MGRFPNIQLTRPLISPTRMGSLLEVIALAVRTDLPPDPTSRRFRAQVLALVDTRRDELDAYQVPHGLMYFVSRTDNPWDAILDRVEQALGLPRRQVVTPYIEQPGCYDISVRFAPLVETWLQEKGTLRQLETLCRCHRMTLARYKDGTRRPTLKIINRLAEVLGVTSYDLMGRAVQVQL